MQLVDNPTATATIRSTETRITCWMEWLLEKLYEGWGGKGYFITGTALHTAFDMLIKGVPYDVVQDLLVDEIAYEIQMYETAGLDLQWTKTRPEDEWYETSLDILKKWYDNVHPDGAFQVVEFSEAPWPPKSEVWLDVKTPDFHLKTQVDAIFDNDWIVDWKTGASKSADDRQLHVYWWGARQMGLVDEDAEFDAAFFYADHQELKPASMVYPGDEAIYAMIAEAERRRRLGVYFYEPSWKCRYCAVADVCPAWDNEDALGWPELMGRAKSLQFNGVNT